jgi:hypothetical protein
VQAEDSNNDHDNDNNDGDGDDERLAGPRQATALLVLTRPSSGKQSECRCNACVNLQPGEPVLVDVSSANPPLTHTHATRTALHRHPSPSIAAHLHLHPSPSAAMPASPSSSSPSCCQVAPSNRHPDPTAMLQGCASLRQT